jgi:predicted DNA repair protein MutK
LADNFEKEQTMASAGLLALLDDIATLLDDVSLMTKVAAKKTAGVLGDDLALNAQQVSGVKANRELPVVWAVAKGSFINKLILVPLALLISATMPMLVTVLLMLGGLYLCYEGTEKIAHKWLHDKAEDKAHHQQLVKAVSEPEVDIKAFEKEKIKGAIRTDFILSAEIIVIALGVAQAADFKTQLLVVSLITLAMTVGVYGLVAGIVKFDDAGLALLDNAGSNAFERFKQSLGRGILFIAPRFMSLLSLLGMLAMFLVGGGILVHGLPFLHHLLEPLTHNLGLLMAMLLPMLFNALVGLLAGSLVIAAISGFRKVF